MTEVQIPPFDAIVAELKRFEGRTLFIEVSPRPYDGNLAGEGEVASLENVTLSRIDTSDIDDGYVELEVSAIGGPLIARFPIEESLITAFGSEDMNVRMVLIGTEVNFWDWELVERRVLGPREAGK